MLLWRQSPGLLALLACVTLQPCRVQGAAPDLSDIPTLRTVAPARSADPAATILQGCTGFTQNQCFNPIALTRFVNVATFFDAQETSSSSHYFMKLFRNDTADSLRLQGMGFVSTSSSAESHVFQAAGVILSGTDLVFPRGEALLNLRAVQIPGNPFGQMTCVEFDAAIDTKGRRVEAVLAPGEAAWAVLRFPTLGVGVFLGILADTDVADMPCDYMTQDTGEHWFRPDPLNTSVFDWGITVFTTAVVREIESPPPTWSLVKALYR